MLALYPEMIPSRSSRFTRGLCQMHTLGKINNGNPAMRLKFIEDAAIDGIQLSSHLVFFPSISSFSANSLDIRPIIGPTASLFD
jgi:hypothetical protein